MKSAATLASKKHAAASTVSRRKSEPTGTNSKKNVTGSNNMANVRKRQRQRRELSKDQSQSALSAVSAVQRRASWGQNRKKESTRATTENKRTPARRKVCNRNGDKDKWKNSYTVKSQNNILQLYLICSFRYDFKAPVSVSHVIDVNVFHFCVVHNCVLFSITYSNLDIMIIKVAKYILNENKLCNYNVFVFIYHIYVAFMKLPCYTLLPCYHLCIAS
jgi:hypothetical protein